MSKTNACPNWLAYRGWQFYPVNSQNQAKKQLILDAWNVHTHMDREASSRAERRTALIARQLACYHINIAAISKTRVAEEGSVAELKGGYTFFWKGNAKDEE